MNKNKVLLLTLVHPDFLPPVYAVAQVLRDLSYSIHILTFDSYTPAPVDIGDNIIIESVGKHHDVSTSERLQLRRKFKKRAELLVGDQPLTIIAFCPFSFLCSLKIKKNIPVIYIALEVADFILSVFLRSPLSNFNNLLALKNIDKANLVATPSVQRSAWLAGRSHLNFMPLAVLNATYLKNKREDTFDVFKALVPEELRTKKIILYTGAVNSHLCILELVKAFYQSNNNGSTLIITGVKDNPYGNEIKEFIKNNTSSGTIMLLPYLTRMEMLSLQSHADIGVCLAKEYNDNLESKMMAPNKVGEYLAKGLYILGIRNEYMLQFEMKGVASLSLSPDPDDICRALNDALQVVNNKDYKPAIREFVQDFYCMQQQLKPVIKFISAIQVK